MTITLDDIRAQMAIPSRYHGGTGHFAMPLLDVIAEVALTNPDLRANLDTWLNEGGTVLLRDGICAPFRNAPCVLAEQGTLLEGKRPYAFEDMWTSMDTAWLHCAIRDELRPAYADDIPKAPEQATLLHDPFRGRPAWVTLFLRRGMVVRDRHKTRADAYHAMAAMNLETIPG